jgi:Domain of unknown function (DUF4153)
MSETSAEPQATTAAQPSPDKIPADPIGALRFCVLTALLVLGDWLFFERPLGISVALFISALAIAAAVANPIRASLPAGILATALVALACVPLVLMPTTFSVLIAVVAVAYLAVALAAEANATESRIRRTGDLLLGCGWRILLDLAERPWVRGHGNIGVTILAWLMPLTLGAVFLWLFAAANPLIESWFNAVNPEVLFVEFETRRVVFWLIAAVLVWPFVFVRMRDTSEGAPPLWPKPEQASTSSEAKLAKHLFGKPAMLRALLVFNAIFAVETGLDLAYLWGGMALPDGMTYATYAHRGAYPLIATALLAAAFVVLAMRPGSEAEKSPLLRGLVYVWIAQNVVLVISALLRLELYVEVYSLTYLRVAAFVCMLLVAIGLLLVVVRLAAKRSNAWLIKANLISLVLALYACGFVNVPALIADFNVTHSRELSGEGSYLDVRYLHDLGPQAVPALDRFIAHPSRVIDASHVTRAIHSRKALALQHIELMQNWRAWTFWNWELSRYLGQHPAAPQRAWKQSLTPAE